MMRSSACLCLLAVATACAGGSLETPDSSTQGATGVDGESEAASPGEAVDAPSSNEPISRGEADTPDQLGEGLGGAGGSGGEWLPCPESYPLFEMAAWVPRSTPSSTVEERLAALGHTLTGQWRGNVTTAWVPAYPIQMTFDAEGHYSAVRMPSDSCSSALYWGMDEESDLKQYRLNDVDASGAASGELDMVWCYEETGCYIGWAATVTGLESDSTGNRIRFDLHNERACCPVHVELERVAQ